MDNDDTGAASSLINVGQQVGGSIGLAVVGTVAWSAVASSLRSQAAAAARAGVHATGARAAALQTQIYHHALATGFSRGYLVSAGILALAVIIALAVIRVTRQDLSGATPALAAAGDVPHQAGREARNPGRRQPGSVASGACGGCVSPTSRARFLSHQGEGPRPREAGIRAARRRGP